jgi:hypothetical protein
MYLQQVHFFLQLDSILLSNKLLFTLATQIPICTLSLIAKTTVSNLSVALLEIVLGFPLELFTNDDPKQLLLVKSSNGNPNTISICH